MIPLKIETLLEGRVVEHDRVEYKNGWNPDPIIHSICAFAKGTGIPKILRELIINGSPEVEFDMDDDRTYLNTIIHIRSGFEMSESMSELEIERMKNILMYLNKNKEINSSNAAELLNVEVKTASRLLFKAEKLKIIKGAGKTKNKVYFIE